MIVKAKVNQSWLDLALQYLGDAGRAYECAWMNGALLHESPDVEAELVMPDDITDARLVKFFGDKKIFPASKYIRNNLGGFLLKTDYGYVLKTDEGKIQID